MLHLFAAYCATLVVFLAIDFVWLSAVARGFYGDRLGPLLLDQPRIGVAAAFYMLYVAGILVFVVLPALKADSGRYALAYGALFGLVAYATYDMTNYATLRHWPLSVALVDMAWGTVLTAVSAAAGYHATRLLFPSVS